MNTLIAIGGLPGSGKTTYAKEQYHCEIIDDIFSYTKGGKDGRRAKASELARELANNPLCIIDVSFCLKDHREELVENMKAELGDALNIEWVMFENDPIQCTANVKKRNGKDAARYLETLNYLTERFSISNGAEVRKVYRPKD